MKLSNVSSSSSSSSSSNSGCWNPVLEDGILRLPIVFVLVGLPLINCQIGAI